jgi:hypothetical protein
MLSTPRTASVRLTLIAALVASVGLAACGGSDDEGNGGGGSGSLTLTCDTTKYVAGAVALPTADQFAKYVGTYNGDEGAYGPNPGDPFVKSASATLVLGADGTVTYKGAAQAVTSVCLDKAAGPVGTVLYVIAGKGHLDIADKADPVLGSVWGVSPADGTTTFTNGKKK